jgi:hypothetical protein
MWTSVGVQSSEHGRVVAMAQLQFDCLAGYEAAALSSDPSCRELFAELAQQARAALGDWQAVLQRQGHAPATPAWSCHANRLKGSLMRRLGRRALAGALYNNAAAQVQACRRLSGGRSSPEVQGIAGRYLESAERGRQRVLELLR